MIGQGRTRILINKRPVAGLDRSPASGERMNAANVTSADNSATFACTSIDTSYPRRYTLHAIEVRQTAAYARWFERLRDRRAQARILVRVRRLSLGNRGDCEPVGEGVTELRIDYGPGYRVYFVQRGSANVILLAGGDKRSQRRDIANALKLARDL